MARHDIDPYQGRAIPDTDLLKKDIELFRNANCNYIRTAHYPPDEYLLDLCDRYGLFVEDEAPVCWNWKKADKDSWETAELIFYTCKSMLYRDRNHPSVIIWSIANESSWSPQFQLCRKLIKQETPHIPVKFSHSEYFGILTPMDVGSRHYPGWQGLMKYDNYFRPVFFDEALHINSYNTSENITDPGLRDLWGDYVKYFSDQMEKAPAVAGIGLWSAIDEMFYPQKHSPCGYGPWGIIDGFRRPKPEYWHVKMAFSPVQVLSRNFHSIENQTTIWLENRYNVSDLNTLDIQWRDGEYTGRVTTQGKPGDESVLLIPHTMQSDLLELEFIDKRGFTISRWGIPRESFNHKIEDITAKGRVTTLQNDSTLHIFAQDISNRLYSPYKTGGL